MFNSACKYAIRAVLYLSLHSSEERKVPVRELADQLEAPQPFLAQLLRQLVSAGLASSAKGPGGGFYLSEADSKKTLYEVVTCVDPGYNFSECILGLARCDSRHPCPVHHLSKPFRDQLMQLFREKTQGSLAEEIRAKGTLISLKGLGILAQN